MAERFVRDEEVPSSNLGTPTTFFSSVSSAHGAARADHGFTWFEVWDVMDDGCTFRSRP